MEHCMTGPVRCCASPLRNTLAEVSRHAAERALVDAALLGPGERHPVMLQLDDGRWRFLAHELNRVLVPEPVGALDGVVHVPTPIILTHVPQRCTDAALGSNRMATCWKKLADASR